MMTKRKCDCCGMLTSVGHGASMACRHCGAQLPEAVDEAPTDTTRKIKIEALSQQIQLCKAGEEPPPTRRPAVVSQPEFAPDYPRFVPPEPPPRTRWLEPKLVVPALVVGVGLGVLMACFDVAAPLFAATPRAAAAPSPR